jgi:hypothetical protein
MTICFRMGFRTKLENTRLFIHALAVLHNLARGLNDPRPPDNPHHGAGQPRADDDDDEDGDGDDQRQPAQPVGAAAARVQGKMFRERIFNQESDLPKCSKLVIMS